GGGEKTAESSTMRSLIFSGAGLPHFGHGGASIEPPTAEADDRRLIDELRRWCEWYPRFGSERVHQLLLGTGWRVNFKRVHRLWKQEHLQVPGKQRKRRRLPGQSANGCVRHRARHRNHVWSYDFLR